MVTTRSDGAKAQAKIEDFSDGKKPLGSAKPRKSEDTGITGAKPSSASKRKTPSDNKSSAEAGKPTKKRKTDEDRNAPTGTEEDKPIIINRAPVLHLWSACVAQAVHPDLSWETCLSAGSTISTITAITKGRSIGKIESSEDTNEKRKKREQRPQEDDVIAVMQFKLRVKDGLAFVGSEQKGKPGVEGALKSKLGDGYERAKIAFDEALQPWKDDTDELNQRAFHMYEDFRPSVKAGQGGWGKKGELNLETVKSAVSKN